MATLKRKASQSAIDNDPVPNVEKRQKTTVSADSLGVEHDESTSAKKDQVKHASQATAATQPEPKPMVNRVEVIFRAYEEEWKNLKQRQYPPSATRELLFADPGVRKVLFNTRDDNRHPHLDFRIGMRVRNLKLSYRAAEDMKKLKNKTPQELRREEGAMKDLISCKGEMIHRLSGNIEDLAGLGEAGRKAAVEWRRELREMDKYFGRNSWIPSASFKGDPFD